VSDTNDQRGPLLVWLEETYTPAGRTLVLSILILVLVGIGFTLYDYFELLPPGRYGLATLLVLFGSPVLVAGLLLYVASSLALSKLGIAIHKKRA